jgi:hypothetical protein
LAATRSGIGRCICILEIDKILLGVFGSMEFVTTAQATNGVRMKNCIACMVQYDGLIVIKLKFAGSAYKFLEKLQTMFDHPS